LLDFGSSNFAFAFHYCASLACVFTLYNTYRASTLQWEREVHKYPLTRPQKEALTTIIDLTTANAGVPPSLRELSEALGKSNGATVHLIKRLIARGHLRKLPHAARTLQVVEGPAV
jgi:DNA-binding MarR family transcriptional regulator